VGAIKVAAYKFNIYRICTSVPCSFLKKKKKPNGNNNSTDRHAGQTQATYWRSHELLYEILTSTMNVYSIN